MLKLSLRGPLNKTNDLGRKLYYKTNQIVILFSNKQSQNESVLQWAAILDEIGNRKRQDVFRAMNFVEVNHVVRKDTYVLGSSQIMTALFKTIYRRVS